MKKLRTPLILTILMILLFACTPGQSPPAQTESEPGPAADNIPQPPAVPPYADALPVEDLEYMGAFRLPGGDERPQTFA